MARVRTELSKFKVRYQKSDNPSDCDVLGYYRAKNAKEAIAKCLKEKQNPDYYMFESRIIATIEMQPFRGDIWIADFSGLEDEQKNERPVAVISNNVGNKHGSTVIVACITSQGVKDLPTHMDIELERKSVILTERIKTIPKTRLRRFIRRITESELQQLEEKLFVSLGFIKNWEQENKIAHKLIDVKYTVDRLNTLVDDRSYSVLTTKNSTTYFLREDNYILAFGSCEEVLLALSSLVIDIALDLKGGEATC